jgi:hypothetical protein
MLSDPSMAVKMAAQKALYQILSTKKKKAGR